MRLAVSDPRLVKPLWRTVRVFISSTFRDMHAERDYLVRVVFPALRERLLPFRVELIDIDLRWGITQEQAENEQVINLCLEQIDDCHFFLGLLAQRYGWVPNRIPATTLARYPWLAKRPGISVTDMEVRHGVLNPRPQPKPVFFCYRDPSALDSIPAQQRDDVFVEADAGLCQRLAILKERVVAQGCGNATYPCRWDAGAFDRPTGSTGRLAGLEEFGRQVEEWLWQAARAELNLPETPENLGDVDPLDAEADLHERFGELRRRYYVGRQALLAQLFDYAKSDNRSPCLLSGPSGSGKSAVLAEFVRTIRRDLPEVWALPHFVGASPASSSLRELLGRLCAELKRAFGFGAAIPEDARARAALFLEFLRGIPETRPVVLVIDALNQLDPADGAHLLYWLPEQLPGHVKLLGSCLDDQETPADLRRALRERSWHRVAVGALSDAEQRSLLGTVPQVSAKTLDARQVERLLANPAAANPLFLLVALEELRVFGSYDRLNQRIADLPTEGDTITALFEQVFQRLEEEFDRDLVRTVLTMLVTARRGLAERELHDLVTPLLKSADLFALLRQLRPYLLNRGGLLNFYHANVARAVRQRYFQGQEDERSSHRLLADHFAAQPLGARKVDELPWQLVQAREWTRLAALFADLDFLQAAWQANEFEVRAHWSLIERESPLRMTDVYRPVVENPSAQEPVFYLALLFFAAGHHDESARLWDYLIAERRRTQDDGLSACVGNQALILQTRGDLDGALALLHEQERLCRRLNDPVGLYRALGNQALVLQVRGDLDGAMNLLREVGRLCQEIGDSGGLHRTLGNQAVLLHRQGDLDGAMALHKEEERLCRLLNDPAGLQASLGNQAAILQGRGRLEEAMALLREQEGLCRQLGDPAGLANSLGSQALILRARGDLEGALALLREQERLCRQLDDPAGLHYCLGNQAMILQTRGDLDGAMTLLCEEERLCRQLQDPGGLSTCLGNQAVILQGRGDLDRATTLLRETEYLCRQLGDARGLAHCLGSQAAIVEARGDRDSAMTLLREAERLYRQLQDPAGLHRALGSQAVLLYKRGDRDGAMALHKEEERLCRELDDPAGLHVCLGNQAVILQARGDLDGALALLQEKERLCRQLDDPAGILACLGSQAMILRARGDLDGALALHREEERLCRQLENPAGLHRCLGYQANILQTRGEFDKPLALHREAERLCRQLDDPAGLQLCLENQAILFQSHGELDRALTLHREAERLCRQLDDPAALQLCLSNQAVIHQMRGDLGRALTLLDEQERLCRKIDEPAGLATCLGNRAMILIARGDLDGAMELLLEKEQLCRKLNDPGRLARTLSGQGIIRFKRGDLDGALALYKEEERLFRQIGDPAGLQTSLGNQAGILKLRGDLDGCLALLREQERLCRQLNHPNGLVTSLTNQAMVLAFNRDDPVRALPLVEEALRLATAHGLQALAQQITPTLRSIRQAVNG
jgi:tetratricopeptide (TPR) repeat protein